MKKLSGTILGLVIIFLPGFAYAMGGMGGMEAEFEKRPLQLQMVIGGNGGMMGYGYNNSPDVGIHLGYFLTKSAYLGVTSLFGGESQGGGWRDNRGYMHDNYGNDNYDFEYYGQEGGVVTESDSGTRQQVEWRIFPTEYGLYFSIGALSTGEEQYVVDFDKRLRTINGNEYKTGLKAYVNYEEKTSPAIGIGYNHIFSNGLSLTMGMNLGWNSAVTPQVRVIAVNPETTVAAADLDYWEKQINANEKRGFSYMGALGIGYAF
ncbi:hypothetical protein WDW89_23725 [Deltaproteobacteria bacterium TL4]